VISKAPPLHSHSNGQVERFHGTFGDIARSDKVETQVEDTVKNILLATIKYKRSIHSVTNERPTDVIHAASKCSTVQIKEKIASAQQKSKDSPLFTERIVEADLGTTVLIKGRVKNHDNYF